MLPEPSLGEVDERPGGAPCGTLTAMRIALARRAAIACAVMAAASLQNACSSARFRPGSLPSVRRPPANAPTPPSWRTGSCVAKRPVEARSSSRQQAAPCSACRAAHPGVHSCPRAVSSRHADPRARTADAAAGAVRRLNGNTTNRRPGVGLPECRTAVAGRQVARPGRGDLLLWPSADPAAAAVYAGLDGISYAEPDTHAGDGPDLEAARVDGDWYLIFRNAWGDCPSASTSNFRTVRLFRRLMAERGWGE